MYLTRRRILVSLSLFSVKGDDGGKKNKDKEKNSKYLFRAYCGPVHGLSILHSVCM